MYGLSRRGFSGLKLAQQRTPLLDRLRPNCGFSAFGPPKRRLVRRLIGATNAMLNPRRRAGGWIFGLFEKAAPQLR
jgi:hypothetical protein